jgi:hypothetical protein
VAGGGTIAPSTIGGSQGYDHKVMGITARGAWEAVKRHFREVDIDIGRVRIGVKEDVAMVEGRHQFQAARQQHAVAEHVARPALVLGRLRPAENLGRRRGLLAPGQDRAALAPDAAWSSPRRARIWGESGTVLAWREKTPPPAEIFCRS